MNYPIFTNPVTRAPRTIRTFRLKNPDQFPTRVELVAKKMPPGLKPFFQANNLVDKGAIGSTMTFDIKTFQKKVTDETFVAGLLNTLPRSSSDDDVAPIRLIHELGYEYCLPEAILGRYAAEPEQVLESRYGERHESRMQALAALSDGDIESFNKLMKGTIIPMGLLSAQTQGQGCVSGFIGALDLSGLPLNKMNLREIWLWGATLVKADLSESDLSGADLWGVISGRSNYAGANFSGVDLTRVGVMWQDNFQSANLVKALLAIREEVAERVSETLQLTRFVSSHTEKFRYDEHFGRLFVMEAMTEPEKELLKACFTAEGDIKAIERLFQRSLRIELAKDGDGKPLGIADFQEADFHGALISKIDADLPVFEGWETQESGDHLQIIGREKE